MLPDQNPGTTGLTGPGQFDRARLGHDNNGAPVNEAEFLGQMMQKVITVLFFAFFRELSARHFVSQPGAKRLFFSRNGFFLTSRREIGDCHSVETVVCT